VFGIYKQGFTLIEILVAIILIGILATFLIPNLASRVPSYERRSFIEQLNSLTQFAWQQAITKRAVFKVSIDTVKRTIIVEGATGAKDQKGEQKFVPIKSAYIRTQASWPEQLQIKQIYIEKDEQLSRHVSSGKKSSLEAWFFVMPDGITQPVVINFVDTKTLIAGKPKEVGLVLNPFTAQFKEYDIFQKP
jgi:prepilin-type N-terminal cleavage/methylation domain-containing protein